MSEQPFELKIGTIILYHHDSTSSSSNNNNNKVIHEYYPAELKQIMNQKLIKI